MARRTTAVAVMLVLAGVSLSISDAPADEPGSLTGAWSARVKAEEAGVSPFAVLTTEAWGNVAGGLEHHGWWNSLLDLGMELDTEKLGWWRGGSFFIQAHWVQNLQSGASFGDYTGVFNPASSIEAGNHLRIFNLYYEHSWGDHQVKLGQLAADDDFMGSDFAGLFVNSAFGAMPSQVGTPLATSSGNIPAFPIYSVAAPGVYLHLRPSEACYTQLGVYYGRPGFDETDNFGFDWARQSPAELGLFWETGYSYKLGIHPGTTRFGLSYHTGPLDDFSSIEGDVPPATTQTVPNFYLVQDIGLIANETEGTRLGLFARAGVTPEPDRSMVSWYADAGLNWFGPLPGRRNDVLGLGVSHTRFGEDFRRAGMNAVAESENTIELTYLAKITFWMVLQPDIQFSFAPARNPDSGSRETAVVLGLRAEITF